MLIIWVNSNKEVKLMDKRNKESMGKKGSNNSNSNNSNMKNNQATDNIRAEETNKKGQNGAQSGAQNGNMQAKNCK
jgi:hypothetical protein